MDLTKFKEGQEVYVKGSSTFAWRGMPELRTVKTVTAKQVRFADKKPPQFFNANRAEGHVFVDLAEYFDYAIEATGKAVVAVKAELVQLDADLVRLGEEKAKHCGA